jgi:hypothetical protein
MSPPFWSRYLPRLGPGSIIRLRAHFGGREWLVDLIGDAMHRSHRGL